MRSLSLLLLGLLFVAVVLVLGFVPVPAAAAIGSSAVNAVTTDIATYGVLVSTIMGAVILVVLAVVGWRLIRGLSEEMDVRWQIEYYEDYADYNDFTLDEFLEMKANGEI